MIQIGLELLLVLLILGATRMLGFWAFLVLLGGILSYLGDQLGTYFGKKRLSLFGIRPKHTAVLISLATGTLITLATLLAAGLISSDYREALLGVKQKKEERERLTQENFSLVAKEKELAKTLSKTEDRLKKQEEQLRQADKIRRDLAHEIDELKQDKEATLERIRAMGKAFEDRKKIEVAVWKGAYLILRPVIVSMDVTKEQLRTEVSKMLVQIQETVKLRGVIVPAQSPDKIDRDLVGPLYEQVQQIVHFYDKKKAGTSRPRSMYIRATSGMNVSTGEKLSSVDFVVQPNLVVFSKGEVIAQTPVDGRLEPEKILQQLFNLDRGVQGELRRKGVLDEALQRRLEKVPAALMLKFMKIVELVKQLDRWVTIQLVADQDVLAFGEISATYRVLELQGTPDRRASNASASPRP